jgi:hypothetical protein
MKSIKLPLAFALSLPLLFNSCSEGKKEVEYTEEERIADSLKMASTQKVFYSIPSPLETSMFLKELGIGFDKSSLNPPENKDKYSTTSKKALNLGVYGANLGYVSIYDKTQEAMQYLKATESLANDLGLSHVFTVENIEKFESSLNNKDNMVSLISDTYLEIDIFLKENDREALSALTIAGGWIEGLFIATDIEEKLRGKKNHEKMFDIILDQQTALDNLVLLTGSYQNNDELTTLNKQLLDLKAIFDNVVVDIDNEVKVDESTGTATIGGTSTSTATQKDLEAIGLKVKEIRNSITSF